MSETDDELRYDYTHNYREDDLFCISMIKESLFQASTSIQIVERFAPSGTAEEGGGRIQ